MIEGRHEATGQMMSDTLDNPLVQRYVKDVLDAMGLVADDTNEFYWVSYTNVVRGLLGDVITKLGAEDYAEHL